MSDSPLQLQGFNASGLTQPEAEYVYNCEVLGLPAKKAAALAGLPVGTMIKPHLQQARELLRKEVVGQLQLTKQDVVHGIHDAIGRAKILAEPATEIMGWDRISKLLGFDAPQQINVNIAASVEVLQHQVRALSDSELVKLLGENTVIDGDFYEVKPSADPTP